IAHQGWNPLRVLLSKRIQEGRVLERWGPRTSGFMICVMMEQKSSGKDVHGTASKSNASAKGSAPPLPSSSSSKVGTSTAASGPVSEEEIRAVLKQKTRVTTQYLVAKFKARLRCREDKYAFAEILKRISKIQRTPTSNRSSY
ncbi:hypothetical protein S245_047351, partial [Arachis hypogaea]